MRFLLGVVQSVLWVSDGIHELRKSYHPIEDLRTYRTWRRDNRRKVAA